MSAFLAAILPQLIPALLGAGVGWLGKWLHVTIQNPAVPAAQIPTAQPVNGIPPLILSLAQSFVAWEQQQAQQQQHADVVQRFTQVLKTQGAPTLNTPAAQTFTAPAQSAVKV